MNCLKAWNLYEELNLDNCLVDERIALIKENKNPYFVRELNTGYVVIGDRHRQYLETA